MTRVFLAIAAMLLTLSGVDALAAEGLAKPWQLGFQDPASPVMERLDNLHNGLVISMTVITVLVMLLLAYVCIRYRRSANPVPSKNAHNTVVEVVWTIIPVIILAAIFIPSYRLHFDCMHSIGCTEDGEPVEPDLTLKIIGYQWYWNYEYPDYGVQFDSYMKKEDELKEGEPRLLAVDNPVYIPVGANVRVQMTGGDVLHSWAMPAFGVKKDTVPGRLNETWFRAEREGTYYGQCSELCGRHHGFMPIQVEVVSQEVFDEWVMAQGGTMPSTDADEDGAENDADENGSDENNDAPTDNDSDAPADSDTSDEETTEAAPEKQAALQQ